jgi:hypothetical protein
VVTWAKATLISSYLVEVSVSLTAVLLNGVLLLMVGEVVTVVLALFLIVPLFLLSFKTVVNLGKKKITIFF